MKATNKKATNKCDWSIINKISKDWKDGGLMRVVKFLDSQKEFKQSLGIQSITIDLLKETKPEYFKMNVRNPKTKVVTAVDRALFSPRVFAQALRSRFGVITK
jgi:hypothetical protein